MYRAIRRRFSARGRRGEAIGRAPAHSAGPDGSYCHGSVILRYCDALRNSSALEPVPQSTFGVLLAHTRARPEENTFSILAPLSA